MLKILSAKTIPLLEKEAEGYEIESIGNLSISNGHYFLTFLGEPKKPKVKPKTTPKKTTSRKSSAKKTES